MTQVRTGILPVGQPSLEAKERPLQSSPSRNLTFALDP